MLVALVFYSNVEAQQNSFSNASLKELKKKEDSLKVLSKEIVYGKSLSLRKDADSLFTKMFVRALLVPFSYNYPFDSLNISKLESPDKNFKIFTWQLAISENLVLQKGAIQMKTADGKLKLFPLIDKSDVIQNAADTITDNLNWYGAIYYRIISKKDGPDTIYTLLGLDVNSLSSNKKVIELLSFKYGKPVFGEQRFQLKLPDENLNKANAARYFMEYNKEAQTKLNYDPQMDMILFEHLVPADKRSNKRSNYVPDGDYQGMKWVNGKWVFVDKVFEVVPQKTAPVPVPLRDEKGRIDNSKIKTNGEPSGE